MGTGSSGHISQVTKILLTAHWAQEKPELPHAQNSKVSHPVPGQGTHFAVKNRHEKQSCGMAPVGAQLQLNTFPQLFHSGDSWGKDPLHPPQTGDPAVQHYPDLPVLPAIKFPIKFQISRQL